MNLSIANALPNHVIKALSNTLLHSLWQGLILAAIGGLIIILTRKATATLRYNLLVAALLLFASATVYTFVGQLQIPSVQINGQQANTVAIGNTVIYQQSNANTAHVPLTQTIASYLSVHANVIVLIWFLIVVARSLQLLSGLQNLYYIRRRSVFNVDAAWQNRVNELANKLGIKQAVSIAESGVAKVPMVIGHLKPLILIPAGLITAMPPAEIDAILVHELAHVARRDYLINLLQSMLEIVFFFNPAVLWISALIKEERENCCDDIAIAQTSSKVNYIRALVSCQEYRLAAPAYAMALGNRKSQLLSRVKRMLSENNQTLNLAEKSVLAICLVAAGLVTTAFSNKERITNLLNSAKMVAMPVKELTRKQVGPKAELNKIPKLDITLSNAVCAPTIKQADTQANKKVKIISPESVGNHTSVEIPNGDFTTYLYKRGDVLYQVNVKDSLINSVEINGKPVANNNLSAYQYIIDRVHTGTPPPPPPVPPVEVVAPAEPVASPAELSHLDAQHTKLSLTQKRLDVSPKKLNINLQKINNLNVLVKTDSLKLVTKITGLPTPVSVPAAYVPKPPAYSANRLSYTTYSSQKPNATQSDNSQRDEIIADMVSDGIITKSSPQLSFKISDKEFIVNGKKQPDNVYQKYRALYVKVTGKNEWTWYYNYNTSTETNQVTTHAK